MPRKTFRKHIILFACLVLGAIAALPGGAAANAGPATASVDTSSNLVNTLAASACAEEKQKLGKRAFRKRYGKKSAKSCNKRTRKDARAAVAEGTAECQAELEDYGEEDFYSDWESFSDCVADYSEWIMGGGTFEDDPDDPGDDEDPDVELPF